MSLTAENLLHLNLGSQADLDSLLSEVESFCRADGFGGDENAMFLHYLEAHIVNHGQFGDPVVLPPEESIQKP